MEGFIAEFARQGLGYLISVLLSTVIIWQQRRIDGKDQQISELQDKRLADTNAYTTSYTATIKEVLNTSRDGLVSMTMLQRSIDTMAQSLNNFINKQ